MNLIERDLKHIWHPCSQMKDYLDFPPLIIKRARGAYFTLETGQRIIDAISSWWCKNLGHNHPRLKKALKQQLNAYEHVIGANTYQKPLIELSEKLATLSPGLNKVFYAGDGSSAVEIAIKMSLHSRYLEGNSTKREMMALRNGYHGESALAMSVSDLSLYKRPYESLMHPVHFLEPIPMVFSINDPLFQDCSAIWPSIEKKLQSLAHRLSFIIFEPLLQASGGMQLYSADFLRKLQAFANKHDIHLIADEIMTGFGRTGYALACHYANIKPDFICLSKGLTAGFLPMSAVLMQDKFYQQCFDDYQRGKSFLHSNTFSGNALAAAVALEHLKILEEENYYERVRENAPRLGNYMKEVMEAVNKGNEVNRAAVNDTTAIPSSLRLTNLHSNLSLTNLRSIGAMVAADIIVPNSQDHLQKRYGYEIYKSAVKMGALLRPLGNTLYWTPPLNTDHKTLVKLRDITIKAIRFLQL